MAVEFRKRPEKAFSGVVMAVGNNDRGHIIRFEVNDGTGLNGYPVLRINSKLTGGMIWVGEDEVHALCQAMVTWLGYRALEDTDE